MTESHTPIAVVGVSTLFPGSVDSTGFWRDILKGSDLITDVPASHWLVEDYYDPDPSAPDKTYANRGAFVPKVDFDPMAWGVPPSTIPATDTCQLLSLIVAQRVLEDASRGQFDYADRDRMSVILGVTSAQELLGAMVSRLQRPIWTKALREMGLPESEVSEACERIEAHYTPWQEATFPGVLGNVVAGRIANRLNLGGTNCVTDAACASTFSALSMAVNELTVGQSDVVICGGADTMNDIFMYLCFSKTPALSKSGDCRPFSSEADGTMLGEGFGMVALKRLDAAEADGDRIYAVVRGVGSSSDGAGTAVYAPVPAGQAKAIRRAYAGAGYGPETVELVEAHGTGTIAGDAAEFEGLRAVFDETGRESRQWCALGSVKSQIGHTKAAAGAAGLVKAVFALHHGVLPPTIKVEQPNPKLRLEESPFHLNTRARPWVRGDDHPRRAGVSSFGFGGSNFHVAVEEYTGTSKAYRRRATDTELFILSGASAGAVAADARKLGGEVAATLTDRAASDAMFRHLCRASQERYDAHADARLSIVAEDAADLADKLDKAAGLVDKGESFASPGGIVFGMGSVDGDVAFVFPGQGSQYVDMGASVAMTYPEALSVWDRAASLGIFDEDLHEVVFPRPAFSDAEREAQAEKLTATEWAQPAIGVTSLSHLALLSRLGISPAAVTGHSFGEVIALYAAGAIGLDDAISVARRRGELMAEAAKTPGAMTAVSASAEVVREKLATWDTDVVVANHNGPAQVVLSGPTASIEAVEGKLKEAKLRFRRLGVATAFHSKVVSASTEPFGAHLDGVPFAAPNLPVYGNTEAAPYPAEPAAMRGLLANQLAKPVRFVESIEAMYENGARIFVEVGPGSVLTGLIGRILDGRPHRAVSLDKKGKDGMTSLHHALAHLVAAGVPLDLGALWHPFLPAEDPREQKKPKLSVPIGGSNHGKPYPPENGAAGRPTPNPERPPTARATEAARTVEAPRLPRAQMMTEPKTTAIASLAAPPAAAARATQTPALSAPTASPAAQTAAHGSEWASAYHAVQSKAIDAHTAYMQAMATSHSAFLSAQQSAMQAMATMAGQAPMVIGPVGAVAPAAPVAAPTSVHVPAPARSPVTAPVPVVAGAERAAAHPPSPSGNVPVNGPNPTQRGSEPPPTGNADLMKLMLAVVAEKTGYPVEMLELDMDLAGDLGVDSIKRVEILAAMKERAEGLPEVDPAELGKLRTLQEIVDRMSADAASAHPPSPSGNVPVNGPNPTQRGSEPPPTGNADLMKLMLAVVAEKTGYPVEMLELDMDLAGDLGVDSIKRVEILAAMKERAEGLPEVDPAELGKLRTLQEIVDRMSADATSAHPPSTSGNVQVNGPSPTQRGSEPPPTGNADLMKLMLAVVAEKTGYPVEMLELDMDLAGDLGVDSIKRVEILAAMKERAEGLPEVDPAELGKLRTLQEIVDRMSADATSAHPPSTSGNVQVNGPSPTQRGSEPPPTGNADLMKLMLAVVAEKTGYPVEMLELDMDLAGDLGVDSIKRVEILAAMKERAEGLPEIDPAELGKLRTLQEIVDRMSVAPHGNVQADGAAAKAEPTASASTRWALRLEPAPANGFALGGLLDARAVAVVDGGSGLATRVAGFLEARGVAAKAGAPDASTDGVVFLGGLAKVTRVDDAIRVQRAAFEAAKCVAARLTEAPGVFVTVQDTGGDFGLGGKSPSSRAWLGGLPGLVKTAQQEWPLASCRAIDIARSGRGDAAVAEAIAKELLHGGSARVIGAAGAGMEVALRADGSRSTLVSYADEARGQTPRVTKDSVIVASGGARGVTAETLIALAEASHARFVLLGRTPLEAEPESCAGARDDAAIKRALLTDAKKTGSSITPAELGAHAKRILAGREVRGTIKAIEERGGAARYVAASVTDRASLDAALEEVRADWGPITGVIHGAGLIADRFIADKSLEDWDRVFGTKVLGLRALLEATADDPLSVLVAFSSVAGRCGNRGQADYAMANETLNKVVAAEVRRRRAAGSELFGRSLGWGPWEGGMVTPALKQHFERLGVPLIPLAAGAKMLVDELMDESANIELVLGGEPRAEALSSSADGGRTDARFDVLVDHRTFPAIDDHRVKGQPVLPVAIVLELFARAIETSRPDLVFSTIEDLRVLRGVPLERYEDGGDRIAVRIAQVSNGDGVLFRLELLDVDGRIRYSANGTAQHRAPTKSALPPRPEGLSRFEGTVYDGVALFHGDAFRVIVGAPEVGEAGLEAILEGGAARGWDAEGWATDPALVDGGLQLALLWTCHDGGGAALPTAVSRYRRFTRGLSSGEVKAILTGTEHHENRTVSNVVLIDGAGMPVAELLGVEMHVLPGSRPATTARA